MYARRFGVALLLAAASLTGCDRVSVPRAANAGRDFFLPREATVVAALVPRNATLESLLVRHQLPTAIIAPIIIAVRSVFDPRRVKADQPYEVTSALDGSFREFRYRIDLDKVLLVKPRGAATTPEFAATILEIPRRTEVAAMSVEITRDHPSLLATLDAAGETIELGLQLAAILGGEVDFNSELQPGDTIDVLFDRVIREDDVTSYGDVKAVVMKNDDRQITAIRFPGADGKAGWYDVQGRSLKRQFLRSPLPFEPRITSGFSTRRFHPVHQSYRAHLGVDYGAPVGTPVRAVASGTVTFAGWNGEAGRMVRIRHSGGYETSYLHLSALGAGIHVGARVSQEQVIGKVGMTGTATGPHLDYRISRNGVFVNPIAELNRMPKGEPIAPGSLDEFSAERDQFLADMKTKLAAASGPRAKAQGPS